MAKRMHATHIEPLQEHLEELKIALENSPWAGGSSLDNLISTITEITPRGFIKHLWLSAIPQVLCLHLNRLVGHEVKLSHHVMFELELEVGEFCLLGHRKKEETATYSLRSVIVHHGTSRCALITLNIHISSFPPFFYFYLIILSFWWFPRKGWALYCFQTAERS